MVATTGYQAGFESSQTQISFAVETVWGQPPAVPFQNIRYMSEGLAATKTRDRPGEITLMTEAMQALTTRVEAAGDIKVAVSFKTYDEFIACALNNEWTNQINVQAAAGDITITAGSPVVLSSITANKFNAVPLQAGSFIRTSGFTNAVNNGIWRVIAKPNNQTLNIAGPATAITETPAGGVAKVQSSWVRNSNVFRSLYIQQAFASNVFLTYAGCAVTGMTIAGGVGQFINGSFTVQSKQELDAVVDASTGAATASPSFAVMDPVGGFGGVRINDANIVGVLDSFSVTVAWEGAAMEFGMGASAASGLVRGILKASGTLKLYFASLALYDTFKLETSQRVAILIGDQLAVTPNIYVISGPNVVLMNPKVEVTGPGSPVFAEYELEFNPSLTPGEGTIQFDRAW